MLTRKQLTEMIINQNVINDEGVLKLANTKVVCTLRKKCVYAENMNTHMDSEDTCSLVLEAITAGLDELTLKQLKDLYNNGEESESYSEFIIKARYYAMDNSYKSTPYNNFNKAKYKEAFETSKIGWTNQVQLDSLASDDGSSYAESFIHDNTIEKTESTSVIKEVLKSHIERLPLEQQKMVTGQRRIGEGRDKSDWIYKCKDRIKFQMIECLKEDGLELQNVGYRTINALKIVESIDTIINAEDNSTMNREMCRLMDCDITVFDLIYRTLNTEEVKLFIAVKATDNILIKILSKLYKLREELIERYKLTINYTVAMEHIVDGRIFCFKNEESMRRYLKKIGWASNNISRSRKILNGDKKIKIVLDYTFKYI